MNSKDNKEVFEWTDELVWEYVKHLNSSITPKNSINDLETSLEKFKRSKSTPSPIKERVEVLQIAGGTDCKNGTFAYTVVTSKLVEEIKNQSVFDAERIDKMILQLEEIANAWKAARETDYPPNVMPTKINAAYKVYKYPTYESYLIQKLHDTPLQFQSPQPTKEQSDSKVERYSGKIIDEVALSIKKYRNDKTVTDHSLAKYIVDLIKYSKTNDNG